MKNLIILDIGAKSPQQKYHKNISTRPIAD